MKCSRKVPLAVRLARQRRAGVSAGVSVDRSPFRNQVVGHASPAVAVHRAPGGLPKKELLQVRPYDVAARGGVPYEGAPSRLQGALKGRGVAFPGEDGHRKQHRHLGHPVGA